MKLVNLILCSMFILVLATPCKSRDSDDFESFFEDLLYSRIYEDADWNDVFLAYSESEIRDRIHEYCTYTSESYYKVVCFEIEKQLESRNQNRTSFDSLITEQQYQMYKSATNDPSIHIRFNDDSNMARLIAVWNMLNNNPEDLEIRQLTDFITTNQRYVNMNEFVISIGILAPKLSSKIASRVCDDGLIYNDGPYYNYYGYLLFLSNRSTKVSAEEWEKCSQFNQLLGSVCCNSKTWGPD